MFARNPLDEAEQPATDTRPVTGPHVIGLRRVGIAERFRLSGREVAALPSGYLEELPPTTTPINRHHLILR